MNSESLEREEPILQAAAVAQTNVITVFDPAPNQNLNRFYRVRWMRY